ncbi:MAG: VWA domain-containing protein [Thermoguttaceae bacterium]|nr:VWA domain-containing protein [Thermoguttaceae bacterium]
MSALLFLSRSKTALRFAVLWSVFLFAASSQPVFSQGFLIDSKRPSPLPPISVPAPPRPSLERSVRLESLSVDAEIENSVAQVVVSQTFNNTGSSTIEASFVFPIPYDGVVDSLTFLVEGKEFAGQLLDAAEARERYEAIVRENRDPALLEWIGTGLYQTSVFPIPPGQARTVELRYTQLLRGQDGLTEFSFPTKCARQSEAPGKTSFVVRIAGETEIKNVYSPTFDVKVERVANNIVKTTCVLENETPTRDFRLFFDQNADELSAKIQSYRPNPNEDGYFLLLASPKIVSEQTERPSKTVVFTLDVSGSMSGEKIKQARESLKFVLSRLNDGDKFNVVLFGTDVRSFSENLQTVDAASRNQALAFVDSVRSRGSTNIEDALNVSFAQLAQDDSANPKYLFFFSDGEPTTGETNEMKLAQLAREKNGGARFFSFGLGYDVNSRLLDRFVRDGRGQGEYVKPSENIEERVAALYNRVGVPVFTGVEFQFKAKENESAQYFTNQIYPEGKIDVYAGDQLVLVGRYATSGPIEIQAKGQIDGAEVAFSFDGAFANESVESTYAFIERLWATRRVGEIVDRLDLDGPNDELTNELLELSKKHGIMTPYTAFLADDSVALDATAENARRAAGNFKRLAAQTSNMSGFAQRSMKQSFRGAANLAAESTVADEMAMAASPAPTASFSQGGGGGTGAGSSRRPGLRGLGMKKLAAPARPSLALDADFGAAVADSEGAEAPQPTESKPRETVKTIGGKTFYFKDGRWIDSALDKESQTSLTPIVVEQFGDEYFELVGRLGREFSQYLAFDEPSTFLFDGRLYQIEPSKTSE